MREFTITLGGKDYTAKPFNLGELREIARMQGKVEPSDLGFEILSMVLKRADPPVPDWTAIEATMDELKGVVQQVMEAAGLVKPGEAKPSAEEPAAL